MQSKHAGMTLIELMIVVLIIGILAAIAYPSYRDSVLKGNRSEAKMALMQGAQELEKCYTRYSTYVYNVATSPCATAQTLAGAGIASTSGKYLVTAAAGDITASTYKLTATPQGAQADDLKCGTLTQSQDNSHTATGTSGVAGCW